MKLLKQKNYKFRLDKYYVENEAGEISMTSQTATSTATASTQTQNASDEFDPITAEVIRSAFDNITTEMSLVLLRTSGSPVLTESKDFSTVLFDADLNQIGSSGYILLHMASSRRGVEAVAKARVPHDINPGDAFICNDPHTSGALHQGDVGIVMPIFYADELVGWTFSNAHLMDIGGSAISGFAPEARDTFSEALRFPGTRVAHNAVLDEEWVSFMRNNVRVPLSFISDLRSLVAACNVGGERMGKLIEEYGRDTLKKYTDYNIGLTEKALRERISRLPDGTYQTYDYVEYDGFGDDSLNPVFCEMTVLGDQLKFKFSGCPQVAAFINAGASASEGSLIAPIMCQLAPDIPFNEGFWNCLEIDLGEEGSILNPVVPAPVTSGHASGGMRAGRMVQEAIAAACAASDDEELRSRVSGQSSGAVTLGIWFGSDNKGNPSMFMPFGMAVGIGGAGQTTGDGQDCYGMQSTLAIKWADIEVQELDSPVLMLWRKMRANAGGAGVTRGGLAIDEAFTLHGADNFVGMNFQSGAEIPARGASGGLPGGCGKAWLIRNGEVEQLLAKGKLPTSPELIKGVVDDSLRGCQTNIPFAKGDVFRGIGGGGGGLGDPFLRDPALIQQDLIDNAISANAAEQLYGAVLVSGSTTQVDLAATWANRNALRATLVSSANVALDKLPTETCLADVHRQDGNWTCGHCDNTLSSATGSWTDGAQSRQRDLADLFDATDTSVRRRHRKPVTLVEHYCPSCAVCLKVNVMVDEEVTPVYHMAS
jgi:N-methylhydantoinase B